MMDPHQSELRLGSTMMTNEEILNTVFGSLSLPLRKIAIYSSALQSTQDEVERRSCLSQVIGCHEPWITAMMAEYENNWIDLDPASVDCSRVLTDLKTLQESSDSASMVRVLQQERYRRQPAVVEAALSALERLSLDNTRHKMSVVHAGGIAAAVDAMERFPQHASIQRLATVLLARLAFLQSLGGERFFDRFGIVMCGLQPSEQVLDLAIVELLRDAGALTAIRTAVEHNLYKVDFLSGDEDANYEHTLASQQIPVVCEHLTQGKDRESLRRRWCFLRTCLASLLDDTSITPETLSSILCSSY